MPFMQRVQFYGNKWVFSGINSAPAYTLQNFIDILYKKNNQFNQELLLIVNHIIHLVVEVSTKIVERVQYTNSVFEHHEESAIIFPQTAELNKLSQAIIFYENDFDGIFDDKFRKMVYYTKRGAEEFELEYDNCSFYYNPFLRIDSNRFMVLNPTMLVPFAIYNILRISTEYGCRNELVNLYNDKAWYECKQSLRTLDHKLLSLDALSVDLINSDYYKEGLFNVSNDGVLFVRYFCDNALDYNFSNMFAMNTIDVSMIENRWKEILNLEGVIKKDRFYQLTIVNSIGRGVLLPFSEESHHKNVTLSPFELYCVSINERNHPNFLMHYMESKQQLYASGIPPIAEINYLTMYVDNEYVIPNEQKK